MAMYLFEVVKGRSVVHESMALKFCLYNQTTLSPGSYPLISPRSSVILGTLQIGGIIRLHSFLLL